MVLGLHASADEVKDIFGQRAGGYFVVGLRIFLLDPHLATGPGEFYGAQRSDRSAAADIYDLLLDPAQSFWSSFRKDKALVELDPAVAAGEGLDIHKELHAVCGSTDLQPVRSRGRLRRTGAAHTDQSRSYSAGDAHDRARELLLDAAWRRLAITFTSGDVPVSAVLRALLTWAP